MKKYYQILAAGLLILASIACNFPYLVNTPESPSEGILDQAPQTQEPQPQGIQPTQEPTVVDQGGPQVYSGNGVEIALPNSYVVESDISISTASQDFLSEEGAEALQEMLANNEEDILLWGYDTGAESERPTSFIVLKNDEYAGIPLMIISGFADQLFGSRVDSFEKERLSLGQKDALRILATTETDEFGSSQVIYLFKDSEKLWIIVFSTDPNQMESQLTTFDTAVTSFKILSVE